MRRTSRGSGRVDAQDLGAIGDDCVLEPTALVFHPESVMLGVGVYIGHLTILEGYYKNSLRIGDGSWIGPQCFLHSAGGLTIGRNVGVGAGTRIITSVHTEAGRATPILHSPIALAPVVVEDDVDIGISAVILPGVTIGQGAQVGAGAVVTADVPAYGVVAGVPARLLRQRPE